MRINTIKIITGIVAVIFVMIVGIKLFAWYKAKELWSQMTGPVQLFAQISYESISTGLDGTIEYEDILIIPTGTTSGMQADSLYFNVGSLSDFLFDNYDNNQLPEDFHLGVVNFRIPVTHEISAQIYSWNLPGVVKNSDPCQPNGVIDGPALKSMGYDTIDFSLRFDVYRSNDTGLPVIELFADNQYLDSVKAEILLEHTLNESIGLTMVGGDNPFTSMSVEIDQTDFQKRLNHYCADSMGIDSSQYALYLTDELVELLTNSGIELGDEIRSALKAFHIGPSKLAFSIKPSSETSIRQLHHYKFKDALVLLGLQLYVNDKLIEPIDISFNDDQYILLSGQEQREDKQSQHKEESAKKERLTYKKTSVEELAKYIGRNVIVMTNDKAIEGQLSQVLVKSISVNTRKFGGIVTYPVRKKDIQQVKVYR